MKNKREYEAWANMLQRCFNPKNKKYNLYGGRGITVCEQWRRSFCNFLSDVGKRPSVGYSLDRYPNKDGNYEPGNVRWATIIQQNRNHNRNRLITFDGHTRLLIEWAEYLNINHKTLDRRLRLGWPLDRALTLPVMTRKQIARLSVLFSSKIADEDVMKIRESKESSRNLAKEYGVSANTIVRIRSNRTRRWVHAA